MGGFYDLQEVDYKQLEGYKRRVILGENLMLVYVERDAGSTTEHSHPNEQMIYLLEGGRASAWAMRSARSRRARRYTSNQTSCIRWMRSRPYVTSGFTARLARRSFPGTRGRVFVPHRMMARSFSYRKEQAGGQSDRAR